MNTFLKLESDYQVKYGSVKLSGKASTTSFHCESTQSKIAVIECVHRMLSRGWFGYCAVVQINHCVVTCEKGKGALSVHWNRKTWNQKRGKGPFGKWQENGKMMQKDKEKRNRQEIKWVRKKRRYWWRLWTNIKQKLRLYNGVKGNEMK